MRVTPTFRMYSGCVYTEQQLVKPYEYAITTARPSCVKASHHFASQSETHTYLLINCMWPVCSNWCQSDLIRVLVGFQRRRLIPAPLPDSSSLGKKVSTAGQWVDLPPMSGPLKEPFEIKVYEIDDVERLQRRRQEETTEVSRGSLPTCSTCWNILLDLFKIMLCLGQGLVWIPLAKPRQYFACSRCAALTCVVGMSSLTSSQFLFKEHDSINMSQTSDLQSAQWQILELKCLRPDSQSSVFWQRSSRMSKVQEAITDEG